MKGKQHVERGRDRSNAQNGHSLPVALLLQVGQIHQGLRIQWVGRTVRRGGVWANYMFIFKKYVAHGELLESCQVNRGAWCPVRRITLTSDVVVVPVIPGTFPGIGAPKCIENNLTVWRLLILCRARIFPWVPCIVFLGPLLIRPLTGLFSLLFLRFSLLLFRVLVAETLSKCNSNLETKAKRKAPFY